MPPSRWWPKKGLGPYLLELQSILAQGLAATAPLFPPLEQASTFVQQVAHILANHEHGTGQQVRTRLQEWLAWMQQHKTQLGPAFAKAIDQFVRTTRSFCPRVISLL